jgi:nucleotide-binding universal stress UspA family protein
MIEFKTILVPVDFSDTSRKAVNYGLTLALHFNAKLFLAHIVPYSSAPTQTHDVETQQCETARREIQSLIPAEYRSRIGIETIVKIGNIDSELLGIVRDQSVDLIVMGTHGRRYLGRWFIGSVTERLLRKAPVPLLTMSHLDAESAIEPGPVELKRILYATDLPDNSSNGLRYAIKLARTLGAALTVIHAVDHANFIYWAGATAGYLQEQLTKFVQERRRTLSELVTHEETAGLHIETLVVEGKPFKEILRVAEDRAMDIIVLNLQSKGILERAFLGSTAERVVRLSHIPVLSVPFINGSSAG